MTRATPDELDRRAPRATGWKARLLRDLAKQARSYKGDVPEITTSYRKAG